MSKARTQHPNASLTPRGRLKMVKTVLEDGWPVAAAAERFQVDPKTVRKWRDRFLAEGAPGLQDRSSRPKRSPARTPDDKTEQVIRMRKEYRWGPARIGYQLGLASSTAHRIITAAGLGRLDQGDRATARPQRYQRELPGELIHIDIKKLVGIPKGGGRWAHGPGNAGPQQQVGWRYVHTAIDDRTRLGYSEILSDETARTAVGFLSRAMRQFNRAGVQAERVLTDNGPRLPVEALETNLLPARRSTQVHPPVPAADQRQGRTLPPDPPRGMGLHPGLDIRNATLRSLHPFHSPLQSPPTPRSAQLGHTRPNTTNLHRGQPTRAAHLDGSPEIWYA